MQGSCHTVKENENAKTRIRYARFYILWKYRVGDHNENETIFVCLFSRSCIIMPTFKEAERQNCGKKSDSFAVLRLVRR